MPTHNRSGFCLVCQGDCRLSLRGDHNQCPGCGELFNSGRAFDKHRTGSIARNERRCMTPKEMKAEGMSKNEGGWWVTDANSRFCCNSRTHRNGGGKG